MEFRTCRECNDTNHIIITGHTASGKTDTAYLITEFLEQELGYNAMVENEHYVHMSPADRMVEGEDNVFVCDEFSQKYRDEWQVQTFRECRDNNIDTVFVVSSIEDLHPRIQESSTVIRKVDKKTAEIVEDDSSTQYHVLQCEEYFDALGE